MLDFKDWKKTKEDGKSVTMKHDKGHEMVILLKGVPGVQKEALKRLPLYDGGEIGVHKSDMEIDRPENKKEKKWAGESSAGRHVGETDLYGSDSVKKARGQHHRVLGEMRSMPNPKLQGLAKGGMAHGEGCSCPQCYAQGTKDGPVAADGSDDDSGSDDKPQAPVVVNVGQPAQPSVAAQQAATPVNVPNPNVQKSNPSVLTDNGSMSAPGAAQTGQEAVQGQEQIDAAKAQALVPIEQAKQRAIQLNAQQDQDRYNALSTHADNLAANIKDIDPDAYRKNMSAPSKVANAIGLFLGGFSVPFGGHNFAGDYLNQRIQNDIEAQQKNQDKQRTIWGAYNSLYGDGNVASNMAKASMADAYKGQVDQVAAKLGTPQALVNAQKLKSELAITKNKAILEAAGNLRSTPNNPSGVSQQPQNQMQGQPIQQISAPGNPAINSSPNKGPLEPDDYADTPLLGPQSKSKLFDMQYSSPQDRANYPKAFEQYTQAQQADTILGQLHDVMGNLHDEAIKGGSSGYLRRHDPSAGVPLIGHALSNMFIQPATDNQNNRLYDTNKTRLVGDIANALRGTNVSGEAIQKLVDDNTPEHGDTPKTVAQKERAIRIFIKNGVPKSLLPK